jgi:hypothetical protein
VSGDPNHEIADFPFIQFNSMSMVLPKLIHDAKTKSLNPEKHFPCRKKIVYNILNHLKDTKNLEKDLERAFILSEEEIKSHLFAKICSLPIHKEYEHQHALLVDIIRNMAQGNPVMSFKEMNLLKADVIDIGLFNLRRNNKTGFWTGKCEERFVADFCKDTLFRSDYFRRDFPEKFSDSCKTLIMILKEFGPNSSEKGLAFQQFFMSCLLNPEFQGKTLKELPFIKESLEKLDTKPPQVVECSF